MRCQLIMYGWNRVSWHVGRQLETAKNGAINLEQKAHAMNQDSDDHGSGGPHVAIPPDGGDLNRIPGRTGEEVNLEGIPYNFRVTGDAAWDPDSDDFAMFTEEGNAVVAAMVNKARMMVRSQSEAEVIAWIEAETERIAADTTKRSHKHEDTQGTHTDHGEVYDTMVRETIAYALDGRGWRRTGTSTTRNCTTRI